MWGHTALPEQPEISNILTITTPETLYVNVNLLCEGFVFSRNVWNSVIGFGLITLLINFFGRTADWNCYIDTREIDGITD